MNDLPTLIISDYVKDKGTKLTVMSKETGISYESLRNSLTKGERPLRAQEFLSICEFLEIDPKNIMNDA